jgi:hypothetical protein
MRRSNVGLTTKVRSAKTEREVIESLSEPFTDLVLEKMGKDPAFREGLHQEALDCIREGDIDTARYMLREYFNENLPDLISPQPTIPSA